MGRFFWAAITLLTLAAIVASISDVRLRAVDGAVAGYQGSAPFAYGIHQALSPRMRDVLERRYREAGWGDVRLTEGATGACIIVLHRDP